MRPGVWVSGNVPVTVQNLMNDVGLKVQVGTVVESLGFGTLLVHRASEGREVSPGNYPGNYSLFRH